MPAAQKPSVRAASQPPSMRIELIELETFIAVAELGHFSLAAKRLHVTQPSVTSRVQRLESALGTKLLVRTTRKVETTPQGARLLAEATSALVGLRKAVDELRQQARQARQSVVVAATPLLAAIILPPIIRAYSKRFTDIRVQLCDLHYFDVLAALEAGTADFAVVAFDGDNNRFRFEALWSEDLVLVAPADHPLARLRSVTLEEIATCPLMVIEQYEPIRSRMAEELKRCGLNLPPSRSAKNLTTFLGMLDAGLGVALLPRCVAHRAQEAGHAVLEIEGISVSRDFGMLFPRKVKLSIAAQSFRRFVRQAVT
jgi:LysR family transcriptional regulator, carnitine catabolism transcriptional activator